MITRHINYEWLTWGVTSVASGRLPEDTRARIAADRARADALRVITRVIPIPWVDDRSLGARFIGHKRRLNGAWRRSAEMTFGTRDVYLEWFGGKGGGPGFGFSEVRISLDGRLAGRSWTMGCSLGAGGAGGPAVAVLRDDQALRVDPDARHLELIVLREPGSRKRELLAAGGAANPTVSRVPEV